MERFRGAESDLCAGARDSVAERNTGAGVAENNFQCGRDSGRNVGEFDSRVSSDAGRSAFDLDGGDRSAGASASHRARSCGGLGKSTGPRAQPAPRANRADTKWSRSAIDLRASWRADARLLKVIRAVDAQLGNTAQVQRASTDANIPLSLGREAIAIGGGGTGGGAHTLQEWFDCNGRELGLRRILLTMLDIVGSRRV